MDQCRNRQIQQHGAVAAECKIPLSYIVTIFIRDSCLAAATELHSYNLYQRRAATELHSYNFYQRRLFASILQPQSYIVTTFIRDGCWLSIL
jgi:hypothetical protein